MVTPTTSSTASNSSPSSPEFEFCSQQILHESTSPLILSADQLFSGGILLPLNHPPTTSHSSTLHGSDLKTDHTSSSPPSSSSSTRPDWKDINIFKQIKETKKKKNKVDRNTAGAGTELNIINLWPFSRSRSAGSISGRTTTATVVGNRKGISSAPCSRSNSTGRKCPTTTGGVHLGRSSPVWQPKRSAHSRSKNTPPTGAGKVLNVNTPTSCIGYRQRMSCKSDVSQSGRKQAPVSEASSSSSSLFNFRSLFTKKLVF